MIWTNALSSESSLESQGCAQHDALTFRPAFRAVSMNQEHAMTFHPHPVRTTTLHRLRQHQVLSLRRPKGLCVRAERGSLWLTVEGDLADIELAPGDSRIFEGPATVVVGTLRGDAVASITVKVAPSWTQWLHGWLHSSAQMVPA
jgi:hypothetical protein